MSTSNTAAQVSHIAPQLRNRVVAHVADLRLLRVIENRGILPSVRMFNSYRTATRHLVQSLLTPHFDTTANRDTLVLAGFGRFGKTVLHEVQASVLTMFERIIIVDLKAEILVHMFAEQVGFADDYQYMYLAEDIHEPRRWQHVIDKVDRPQEGFVYVVGSGFDSVNVSTALWLADRAPEAIIVARCDWRSSFTADISRECDFHVVSTADLLMEQFHHNGYMVEPQLDGAKPAASR